MSITANLQQVEAKIQAACQRCGRQRSEIVLLPATKYVGWQSIAELADLGIRQIGENQVQAALAKQEQLTGHDLVWHLIGHLQTNKVKKALQLFDVIHSVDSLHLAQEISKQGGLLGKQIPIMLEVNVSGENSKYGVDPEQASDLVAQVLDLPSIKLQGLMCMAPLVQDPQQARPYFKHLRDLRDELQKQFEIILPWLSMGMSQDYEIAIEEGATHVRVGSALFQ